MKPTFTTERLNVWVINTDDKDNPMLCGRTMYVATMRYEDWPGVVCTLSVCHYPGLGTIVDWIETASVQRKKGLASELWTAAEQHYGRTFSGVGCTPEGEAFMAKVNDAV